MHSNTPVFPSTLPTIINPCASKGKKRLIHSLWLKISPPGHWRRASSLPDWKSSLPSTGPETPPWKSPETQTHHNINNLFQPTLNTYTIFYFPDIYKQEWEWRAPQASLTTWNCTAISTYKLKLQHRDVVVVLSFCIMKSWQHIRVLLCQSHYARQHMTRRLHLIQDNLNQSNHKCALQRTI